MANVKNLMTNIKLCGNQVDFEAERKAMQVKMEAEVQELQTHLKLDFYRCNKKTNK